MDYPIWDIAVGGGVLMAVVAIAHVIVAHFAIGGGLLIAVAETLAARREDGELRELARRSSLVLILVSTVFGAISGVGIWVVAGLVSPAAISSLIHTYVWGWAIEWVFFIVEIVAALVYYSTWDRVSRSLHITVGWIYFVAAYLSLVVINGIITFMLTPGRWLESGAFWDGFFNPTYWPSLVLRSGIAMVMAAVFMVLVAQRSAVASRPRQMRYLGLWLVAGVLLSYGGYRWWEAVLPDGTRALFLGASPVLTSLATTRHLLLWALTTALILALVVLVAAPRLARLVPALVLMLAAFAFFAGYERLREGIRKPYLIHDHMFSNGLRVADIETVNGRGIRAISGWARRAAGDDPVGVGRQVFRVQCSACHTLDGYQGMRRALPSVSDVLAVAADEPPGAAGRAFRSECTRCHGDLGLAEMREVLPTPREIRDDPEMIDDLNRAMISATLDRLHEMGDRWTSLAAGETVAKTDLDHPYMPPLVGSEEEIIALGEYLSSLMPVPVLGSTRRGDGR